MFSEQPCVIFTAIRGYALTSSRLCLIEYFLDSGWQVVAATVADEHARRLTDAGVIVEPIPFRRGGLSPLADTQAILSLQRVYHRYHPILIHHFQAKPILFGNLAARFVSQARVVNTITGLGHAFISRGISKKLTSTGYTTLLNRSDALIFQNRDDRQLFVDNSWIPTEKARLIVSSGVDLTRFFPQKAYMVPKTPRILMVARLLWQKGVREFVEAADLIHQTCPDVRFQLAGELDTDHPDAVSEEWIQYAQNNGKIEFLGYIEDMTEQLRATEIFVLPSYYREGAPRVLLEAAACSVPTITTDTPGCREIVRDGETGILVPPQNSKALADAILLLVHDASLRMQMGEAGRKRVEQDFDIQVITQKYIDVYRSFGIEV